MTNSKIQQAFDNDGNVVMVHDAIRLRHYICPDCGEELTFRHGQIRIPHFAHIGGNGNHSCSNESTLHEVFKKRTAELIKGCIEEGKQINISWTCKDCKMTYSGNLLSKAKSVEIEKSHGSMRPDISLFDSDGKLIAGIEVVVTHWPEQKTLESYFAEGIILIEYDIVPDDLLNIENRLSKPDSVSLCFNTLCHYFNTRMFVRTPCVGIGKCTTCQSDVQFVTMKSDSAIGTYTNSDLTHEEFENFRKHNPTSVTRTVNVHGHESLTIGTHCRCRLYSSVRHVVRNYANVLDRMDASLLGTYHSYHSYRKPGKQSGGKTGSYRSSFRKNR